jgi:hypothetical protein
LRSFEEIGTRLGKSAEAARKEWTRALVELQKQSKSNRQNPRNPK